MRFIGLLSLLLAIAGICAAQDTNFSVGPQYLATTRSLFLQPIATPSINLDAPLPPIPELPDVGPHVEDQAYVPDPLASKQPDLLPIYYGYPMLSVVDLTSTEQTPELPTSITGVGYSGFTTVETLREIGYGVPLADAASYSKAHSPRAPRLYTNADIKRLPTN